MFEMLLLAAALVISDQADHGKLREDTKIALEKEIVSLSGYYDCTGMEPTGEKLLRGVNLYKIRPGPVLDGVWTTLPGDGLMKKEKLIFEKRFRAIK